MNTLIQSHTKYTQTLPASASHPRDLEFRGGKKHADNHMTHHEEIENLACQRCTRKRFRPLCWWCTVIISHFGYPFFVFKWIFILNHFFLLCHVRTPIECKNGSLYMRMNRAPLWKTGIHCICKAGTNVPRCLKTSPSIGRSLKYSWNCGCVILKVLDTLRILPPMRYK